MLLAPLAALAADSMTHEETIVRTAYAKLAYAADLNTVYRASRNHKITSEDMTKQIDAHGLHLTLSDFTVGNLSDIADKKYVDVAGQYPDGQDVIHAGLVTISVNNNNGQPVSSDTTTARWGPRQYALAPNLTIRALMPILEQESGISPLVRYCSYTVTVSLQGKSRTYKAWFLFGDNGQIAAGDTVLGSNGGALNYFLDHPVYPDILLHTDLGKIPAVNNFLAANARTEASCKHGDICCDAASLACGVAAAELGRQP
ncbi:MAG: hypothetical protein WCD47_02580 [Candidatus Sulfotelmatobacter sp.]